MSFDPEGGSAVTSISGLDGTTSSLPSAPPSAPTYPGYTFDGWFTAASGGSALTSPYTFAGSTTLDAQWTAIFSAPVVTGSSGATDSVSFDSEGGSAVTSITGDNGSSVTLPTPTFAGRTFLGWFTSGSGGTLVTSPLTLTAASTMLYALWSPNAVVASNPSKPAPTYRVIGVIRSFAIGSSVLTAALKVQIQHLASLIESKHFDDVMLRGNATLPVSAANRKLAETRAVVVEAYLKQLGVHANFKIQFTVSGLIDFYLSVSALAK
ncbi:MAG: InlB B-repeat-containing protein [Acidimicrobiales bacterium]